MDNEERQKLNALFRYGVVSEVQARVHRGQKLPDAIREVASLGHPNGDRLKNVSERSIYRWLREFDRAGIDGLTGSRRVRTKDSLSLSRKFLDYLWAEKKKDPKASVPEIIRRAVEDGAVSDASSVSRTSAWRAAGRMNLPVYQKKELGRGDMRRFAKRHRMRLVSADGKHFRAGRDRLKRVAIHYLDDATRYGLNVVVGYTENAELMMRGLYGVLTRFGRMGVLHVDHGFKSEDLARVCGNKDFRIALVLGRKRYPQGRGKIERFHSTLIDDVLRGLDEADIDPDPESLRLRLMHNLQLYNRRPHEGIGKEIPETKFNCDEQPLEFYTGDLKGKFNVTERRRVSHDNIVKEYGTEYEMPLGYAGTVVTVIRKVIEGGVFFQKGTELIRLMPVDKGANADTPRARRPAEETEPAMPPVTASMKRYLKDHPPVIDKDGNLIRPAGSKEKQHD